MRPSVGIASLVILLASTGCQLSSKWAMDHPEYADKYDKPYSDNKPAKWARMLKQSGDARFIDEESGAYLGGGGGVSPSGDGAGYAEIGLLYFPSYWSEAHVGLTAVGSTAAENLFGGVNAGVRVHSPTRLSPFAGFGVHGGLGYDRCDDDSTTSTCRDEQTLGFAAVYPEVGVHYWLGGRTRLSGTAAYWFNTEGRDSDLWIFGLTISGI